VDADREFFETAEEYFDECIRANDQLSLWDFERAGGAVEGWLLQRNDEMTKTITNFQKLVTKLQQKTSLSL